MGKKHSLVWIAKPVTDIEGKWSSLLHILSPSLPSLHTVFSLWHPVLSVWSLHLCLSCYPRRLRQTHRAAVQMPACEHASSVWQPTSGCLLHLVFHYSFILRAGASSEARRAGQSSSRTKEPFPPRPLLTQISGCMPLPGILLLAITHGSRVIHSHHNVVFGSPCLPG